MGMEMARSFLRGVRGQLRVAVAVINKLQKVFDHAHRVAGLVAGRIGVGVRQGDGIELVGVLVKSVKVVDMGRVLEAATRIYTGQASAAVMPRA